MLNKFSLQGNITAPTLSFAGPTDIENLRRTHSKKNTYFRKKSAEALDGQSPREYKLVRALKSAEAPTEKGDKHSETTHWVESDSRFKMESHPPWGRLFRGSHSEINLLIMGV